MKNNCTLWLLFFFPIASNSMERSNEVAINFEKLFHLWQDQKRIIQESIDKTNETCHEGLIEHPQDKNVTIILKPHDQVAILKSKYANARVSYTFLLNSLDETLTEESCLLQQKKHIENKKSTCSIQ